MHRIEALKGIWRRLRPEYAEQTVTTGDRFLILGLGNPGPKYAGNRHNVGFRCLEYLAKRHGIAVRRKRHHALIGEGHIGPHAVVLAMPQTFMNDSGRAVVALSRWYKVPAQNILVIYDDLDLPLAKLRLRRGGSSGGHKGVQSIIVALGTQDFPRLRVGIGRPTHGDPIDYVLHDFDADQEPLIERACKWAEEIVRTWLDKGIQEAMNEYNGRDLVPLEESSR